MHIQTLLKLLACLQHSAALSQMSMMPSPSLQAMLSRRSITYSSIINREISKIERLFIHHLHRIIIRLQPSCCYSAEPLYGSYRSSTRTTRGCSRDRISLRAAPFNDRPDERQSRGSIGMEISLRSLKAFVAKSQFAAKPNVSITSIAYKTSLGMLRLEIPVLPL